MSENTTPTAPVTDELKRISYAQFGHNFIRHIISATRIRGELEDLLKSSIAGTVRKLPANMIVASYTFKVADVMVWPVLARLPDIAFILQVLGRIELSVGILNLTMEYDLDVEINIHLEVETCDPVIVRIKPQPVTTDNITIKVEAKNASSEILEQLRIIRTAARDEIVDEVNARLKSPEIAQSLTIDVLQLAQSVRPPLPAA